MPKYHFHIRDGSDLRDVDAVDLRDLQTARHEGAGLVGQCLRDEPQRIWTHPDWHLDVTDKNGASLFRIHVIATGAT